MGAFLRKYGAGTGADIYVPIIKRDVVDFAVGADWSPAAGDVKVSKDGGAAANIGTLPTAVTMGNTAMWKFVLADAELQCKYLSITVADSATKAVEDQMLVVETYGNASAMYQADLSAANLPANTVQVLGTTLTEGAGGRLAGGIVKWFNVSSPTGTVNSIPDAVAGAASGLAIVGSAMTLASSAVQAIWDAATTALTVVGSIGKMLVDKLGSVSGQVASQTEVTAIQNNTRVVRSVPQMIERPDSGTQTYRVELFLYDDVGNMEAPDSAPTLDLVDQGGTDLAARLDSATGALVSTGRYRWIYTASSTDDLEQLKWTFSVVEGGATRLYGNDSLIVDTTAADFTSADRTKLDAAHAAITSGTHGNAALKTLIDAIDTVVDAILADTGTDGVAISNATRDAIAGAVWDVILASHLGAGSTGEALNAAGSAGDPWTTALPGAYGAGSAGHIIGNRIDAAISSRLAAASYTAPLDAAGTRAAVGLSSANLETLLATIASYIDTEMAAALAAILAVKTKTDNLPASPAAVGSAMTLESGERDSIAEALLDLTDGVETSLTVRQAMRVFHAVLAGEMTTSIVGSTVTINFRDKADSKNRVVVTFDSSTQQRTAVTFDLT